MLRKFCIKKDISRTVLIQEENTESVHLQNFESITGWLYKEIIKDRVILLEIKTS